MTVYAVFLNQDDDGAWQALRDKWPDRFLVVDERLALVAPSGIVTTREIANGGGINEEEGRVGLVLEVGAYSGFNRGDLWEWIDKANSA